MSGSSDNATTAVITVEIDRTEYDKFVQDFGNFKDTMSTATLRGGGGGSLFGSASMSSIRQSLNAMTGGLRAVNAQLATTLANMRAISSMPVTIKISVNDTEYQRFKADVWQFRRTASMQFGGSPSPANSNSQYRPPHIPVPGIPAAPGAWNNQTLNRPPRTLGDVIGSITGVPSRNQEERQNEKDATKAGPGGSYNVYDRLNATLTRTNALLSQQGRIVSSNGRALSNQSQTWANINRRVYNLNNTFRNMRSMHGMGLIGSLFGLLPMAGGAIGGGLGSILGVGGSMLGGTIGRALGGLVGGLGLAGVGLGVAGVYGMSRLSDTVSAGRRQRLGLGTDYGENQAFGVNFQQYLDPAAALERTANVRASWQNRWVLQRLGVSADDINNGDPAKILTSALPRIRSDFIRGGQSQEYAQAMGLTQLLSMDELRRLANISDKELNQTIQGYGRDKGSFDLNPETQARWNNLNIQLRRAGRTIETTLIDGLTPLATPLDHLTQTVSGDIALFLKSISPKDIEALGSGIDSVAKYLSGDKVRADITWFADQMSDLGAHAVQLIKDFGSVGDAIHGLLARLGIVSDPNIPPGSTSLNPPPPGPDSSDAYKQFYYRIHPEMAPGADGSLSPGEALPPKLTQQPPEFGARSIGAFNIDYNPGTVAAENAALRAHPGVPAFFQHQLLKQEAGWNWRANTPRISPAGAIGVGQMLPATFNRFARKGGNIFDFNDNLDASTAYMQYLLTMFHGNTLVAAAAYNAGEGNKGVLQYAMTGDDRYLPDETRKYVRNFSRSTGYQFGDVTGPSENPIPSFSLTNPANAPKAKKLPSMAIPYGPQGYGRPHQAPPPVHVIINSRAGSDFTVTAGQLGGQ